MGLDVNATAQQMVSAAVGVIGGKWNRVKAYAAPEFLKIAHTLAGIEAAKLNGEITEQEAHILLDMQKNASRSVLIASETMGIVVAEQAINAALAVVRDAVNKLIGWPLV